MAFSKLAALAAVLVLGTVTVAVGQADPIAARKAMMKANGGAVGTLVKMVKGETPFDAAAAKAALETIGNSKTYADLFPVGSDQGDTKALPTIWSDNAGFRAALDKLLTADAAQLANPPQDVNGVKAALGAIGPACKGCHDTYRKPS
jgi:cytochrome c556